MKFQALSHNDIKGNRMFYLKLEVDNLPAIFINIGEKNYKQIMDMTAHHALQANTKIDEQKSAQGAKTTQK